jgi:hypothetical protein
LLAGRDATLVAEEHVDAAPWLTIWQLGGED